VALGPTVLQHIALAYSIGSLTVASFFGLTPLVAASDSGGRSSFALVVKRVLVIPNVAYKADNNIVGQPDAARLS
jgi:hypothetical protein